MSEQPGARPGLDAPDTTAQRSDPVPPGGPVPPEGRDPAQPDRPPAPPLPPGDQGPGPVNPLGRRAMWIGIASVPLSVSPYFAVGLVLAVTALILGIKARRQAGRTHGTAPGAQWGIVTGALGTVISLSLIAFSALIWNELSTYNECRQVANTNADEDQCRKVLNDQLEKRFRIKLPDNVDY